MAKVLRKPFSMQRAQKYMDFLHYETNGSFIWNVDSTAFVSMEAKLAASTQSEAYPGGGDVRPHHFLHSDLERGSAIDLSVSKLCREERLDEALRVADLMSEQGMPVSKHTIHCLLQECSKMKDLAAGRQVYSLMVSYGLDSVAPLVAHLISVLASCGSLVEAHQIFIRASDKNVVLWDAIISAYANLGEGQRALELYQEMQQEGIKPNKLLSVGLIKACTSTGDLGAFQAVDIMEQQGIPVSKSIVFCLLQGCSKTKSLEAGRHVHSIMINAKLDSVPFLGDHLIRHFASCGSLQEASQVFRKVSKPSVYTWNAIISAHANLGEGEIALDLYHEMQRKGITPNKYVYLCILKACSCIEDLEQGRIIHDRIVRSGLEADVIIGNALVDMYAKCQDLEEARKLFDKLPHRDMVSWGAMITGYAQHGHGVPAIELYEKMLLEGILPGKVIILCSLKACSRMGAVEQGRMIHEGIIHSGGKPDVNIGSTLVDMYAKCGSLEEAKKVFGELPNRNVVSWGAMIGGYAQHGHGLPALELFQKMQEEGVQPNRVIFLSVLKACASIGALGQGRFIHDQIIKSGIELDVVVGSTLVDMYAKCGNLEETRKMFDDLPSRNVVSWGAIIGGYARYGICKQAEACLKDMQQQGLKPDDVILAYILSAYSHAGLLEEGRQYFKFMKQLYGALLGNSHYNCMIDLLCRCGCLEEAVDLIASMPISPDSIAWKSVLNGCRAYGNVELGRHCFDEFLQLDPSDAAGYVLVSNIYADAHMWEEVDRVHRLRKGMAALKKPGTAWIEINNVVHEFFVGQKSVSQIDVINDKSKRLHRCTKEDGYVPQFSLVLESFSDEGKDEATSEYCEKVPLALGLITNAEGISIHLSFQFPLFSNCYIVNKIRSVLQWQDLVIVDAYCVKYLKASFCWFCSLLFLGPNSFCEL